MVVGLLVGGRLGTRARSRFLQVGRTCLRKGAVETGILRKRAVGTGILRTGDWHLKEGGYWDWHLKEGRLAS